LDVVATTPRDAISTTARSEIYFVGSEQANLRLDSIVALGMIAVGIVLVAIHA